MVFVCHQLNVSGQHTAGVALVNSGDFCPFKLDLNSAVSPRWSQLNDVNRSTRLQVRVLMRRPQRFALNLIKSRWRWGVIKDTGISGDVLSALLVFTVSVLFDSKLLCCKKSSTQVRSFFRPIFQQNFLFFSHLCNCGWSAAVGSIIQPICWAKEPGANPRRIEGWQPRQSAPLML